MLRKPLIAIVAALALSLPVPGGAFAAANPSGQGQPNQSCEDQPSTAPGFETGGFETAESNYAGEGPASIQHAGSEHAVSQYDVACFQVSQR